MFRAKGSTRAVLGGLRWPRQIAGKHAAQPRFLNTAGASLTKQSLKEESGFSNENRAISGELATVPLTKDERPWIRWPVSAFMILVYRPLLKPLGLFFSDPRFFRSEPCAANEISLINLIFCITGLWGQQKSQKQNLLGNATETFRGQPLLIAPCTLLHSQPSI
ncbi:hypothetical protein AUP68_09586 [Ilyonectria robusta]